MKIRLLLNLCLVFTSCLSFGQAWYNIDDFPSTERDDACVFVIGEKAYCGTGVTTGGGTFRDFYAFDMNLDQWSEVASLPNGEERQYTCAFSSDSKGFVFGGYRSGTFLKDLWVYDPSTDQWTKGPEFPSDERSGSVSFCIEDTAYVLGGRNQNISAISELWAFDMVNGIWFQKNDMPNQGLWRACAIVLYSKAYVLFGVDSTSSFSNKLYEYDVSADSWSVISTFPGKGRTYASMLSIGGQLCVFGGTDSIGTMYNDLRAYDVSNDIWNTLIPMPSIARRGGLFFTNDYALYYTVGLDQNYDRRKDTWKTVRPTGIEESNDNLKLTLFPNPAEDILYITVEHRRETYCTYKLMDALGHLIQAGNLEGNNTEVDVSFLERGLYYLLIENQGKNLVRKVIVR